MERGSLMLNTTTFVGLDVHARSIKAVALDAMTGEVRSATFAYDAAAVAIFSNPKLSSVFVRVISSYQSNTRTCSPHAA